MKRVLFGCSPLIGHLTPMLPIARQLGKDGHAVAVASHPKARGTIEREGLTLIDGFEWGGDAMELIERKAVEGQVYRTIVKEGKWAASFYLFVYNLEAAVRNCLRVIDEWKPDAAVFDILFFPGIIAAELRGLPYASSCPVPSPLPSRDLLPYAFGFSSRQRRMNWLERGMNGCSEWYWGLNTRYVNRVRTHLGLAPIKHLISSGLSPYLYLSYTTSRFEFARSDLPAQVYYIGPARSLPAAADAEFPWDRFGRDPVVYFTMGTLQGDRKVIRRMIEASNGAPWQTVIAIGRLFTVDSFGPLPPNVLLLNWVPQTELMKRVAAVVCHGGFNTVNDALAEGVPLLVLPQAWDHFETAQRVVEAGAGLRLNRPQVSGPALRENTRRLLETASYREAARRLAEDFARCDAARAGADLVLRLAETRQPLLRKAGQEPTVYVEPQLSLE